MQHKERQNILNPQELSLELPSIMRNSASNETINHGGTKTR